MRRPRSTVGASEGSTVGAPVGRGAHRTPERILDMSDLRSAQWYVGDDRNAYIHRAWMRRGLPASAFEGARPHIAIANTASDLVPCNMQIGRASCRERV